MCMKIHQYLLITGELTQNVTYITTLQNLESRLAIALKTGLCFAHAVSWYRWILVRYWFQMATYPNIPSYDALICTLLATHAHSIVSNWNKSFSIPHCRKFPGQSTGWIIFVLTFYVATVIFSNMWWWWRWCMNVADSGIKFHQREHMDHTSWQVMELSLFCFTRPPTNI